MLVPHHERIGPVDLVVEPRIDSPHPVRRGVRVDERRLIEAAVQNVALIRLFSLIWRRLKSMKKKPSC